MAHLKVSCKIVAFFTDCQLPWCYQLPRLRYKTGLGEIRSDQVSLLRAIGGWRCPKYRKDSPSQGYSASKRLAGADSDFCCTRTVGWCSEVVHPSILIKLGTADVRLWDVAAFEKRAFPTSFIAVELCLCWKQSQIKRKVCIAAWQPHPALRDCVFTFSILNATFSRMWQNEFHQTFRVKMNGSKFKETNCKLSKFRVGLKSL